jgi:hypothetical protein
VNKGVVYLKVKRTFLSSSFLKYRRISSLVRSDFFKVGAFALFLSVFCEANGFASAQYLRDASQLYKAGSYFKSARYAFAAFEEDASLKPDAYAWITLGLLRSGLPNSATYFFIRTLQSGSPAAIRSVLSQTQDLIVLVGADLLRKYLIRHTKYEDYDAINRSAYLYALGKDALLSGDQTRSIAYLNGIDSRSPLWPYALHLRGTAYAIAGKIEDAIEDFRRCASQSSQVIGSRSKDAVRAKQADREADDLRSRCFAGEARTLYQAERFEDADRAYDKIAKKSFVWPDILFEQAWNSFAKGEYNRTLGKLVSYKSPALKFVFNSEVDVLRAQSYYGLCLYSDSNEVINEFNIKYSSVGIEVKNFVERNKSNLAEFYRIGKSALQAPLYEQNDFQKLLTRFVRGPYFQNLVSNERLVSQEIVKIHQLASEQKSAFNSIGSGFAGFLEEVLRWRMKSIQLLGGAFVKNSLVDYHGVLLDDFDKMAFIKLETLKYAKEKILFKNAENSDQRVRGNVEPSRRNDQFYWSFNGEFWNDELGDYVFGLESECKG